MIEAFDEKPSRDEAPATCQYAGCDGYPERVVRFVDPQEYLVYCDACAEDIWLDTNAKYSSRLR